MVNVNVECFAFEMWNFSEIFTPQTILFHRNFYTKIQLLPNNLRVCGFLFTDARKSYLEIICKDKTHMLL